MVTLEKGRDSMSFRLLKVMDESWYKVGQTPKSLHCTTVAIRMNVSATYTARNACSALSSSAASICTYCCAPGTSVDNFAKEGEHPNTKTLNISRTHRIRGQ